MRPYELSDYLTVVHKEDAEKPLEYFESLKCIFGKRSNLKYMCKKKQLYNAKGLVASDKIAGLIAKRGNPHTIEEPLIITAVSIVLNTVFWIYSHEIIIPIPLSNSSVSRRIDRMSEYVESQLVQHLRTKNFALQIVESTLTDNTAIAMAYVRYIHCNDYKEEMLFCRKLKTDCKGESIFAEIERYFIQKSISLANIMACATDGAPSMVGRYRGFISYLKGAIPGVFTIHCVVHRQHLVAKSLSGDCTIRWK